MVAAGRRESPAERSAALQTLDEQQLRRVTAFAEDVKATMARIERADNPSQEKGRMLGEFLVMLTLGGSPQPCLHAQDRSLTWNELARVTLFLEAYRAERGAYPESLEQLVPKYLDELPRNRFTGGKLVYRRTNEGVRVYSVGPNGKNDDGAGYGLGVGGEDDVFLPPLHD